MRHMTGAIVLAFLCLGPTIGDGYQAPSGGSSIADALKQKERDFGDAMKAIDLDWISRFIADDFRGVGYSGNVSTKESLLASIKSQRSRLLWFEHGPMDVKMMGKDVAVIQGSNRERRAMNGRLVNISAGWTDVLVKRGDRWVLVRTESARYK